MTYLDPVHVVQCNSKPGQSCLGRKDNRAPGGTEGAKRKAQNGIVKRLVNRDAGNWAVKRGRYSVLNLCKGRGVS
jgi:hypothetical protein